MSKDHEQQGVVTKTQDAGEPGRIGRTERRPKEGPLGQTIDRYRAKAMPIKPAGTSQFGRLIEVRIQKTALRLKR